ncbi:hypothetical protein [Thiohalorhabdus methylotrophus]|uniref:PadR family transcriptional regulator n=1 Tax=Thiohalorhabdus methylotrophus TaxID=3242694 RepID=A0ABV4TW76_9GAMM
MAKLHLKGYILYLLSTQASGLWDHQIAERVMKEYGVSGLYWHGTVRLTLTDLYASGLIEVVEEKLDDGTYFGKDKILICYALSDFGRERLSEALIA